MLNNKTFLCMLLGVWIAGSIYWHVCKIKQLCDTSLITTPKSLPISTIEPLKISDGNKLNLRSRGNFSFAKSQETPNQQAVLYQLDSLATYLIGNPSRKLVISGIYASSETNSTSYGNLGLARAQHIKDWLVQKGIPDSVITTHATLNNNLKFVNDSLSGGLNFTFTSISKVSESHALTEQQLANNQIFENIFKPMNLYFPTASSQYIRTDQNQKFIVAAKKFLEENKDKKLILTGHTDDEDSAEWNLTLSKKRAQAVKKQLMLAGIPAERIVTKGKGEWEPIASNTTLEGKRSNRRVNMVVK